LSRYGECATGGFDFIRDLEKKALAFRKESLDISCQYVCEEFDFDGAQPEVGEPDAGGLSLDHWVFADQAANSVQRLA